jgi:imidazolonepropionase
MRLLLENIHQLHCVAAGGESLKAGKAMADSAMRNHAFVYVEDGVIQAVGDMADLQPAYREGAEVIDCEERLVLPGFVDSHTHLVFARSREAEYLDRIKGLTYEEIAQRGGGILNSAKRLRAMSEEELLESAVARAWEILSWGTTTVEIKSGYGLTVTDELKMLRVAKRISEWCPIRIRTTFLGAHAVPLEYKGNQSGYVDLVVNEMLPQVAEEKLADFIDVFCDRGYFTVEETARIIQAGARYGLKAKIHANELANSGGVQVGVTHGALSVDHLECIGPDEIAALLGGKTMPTALPGCSFLLGIPFAPGRDMIDAGLPLCIASDFNPGSSPGGNMQFMMSLACTKMRLLPEEALVAMTLNGAAALGMSHEIGSIEVGKRADLVITAPMESLAAMPYYFCRDQVETVIIDGKEVGSGF